MTLPYEQYYALVNTRNFLTELCDPTNGHEGRLREEARRLLKHFPMESEANEMVRHHVERIEEFDRNRVTRLPDPHIEYSPMHGGWIFWDETWMNPSKAYLTRELAENAMKEYAEFIENKDA